MNSHEIFGRALKSFGIAIIALATIQAPAEDTQLTPNEIFERRILPIFKSPNPSSCTECHLAGVDLKNYIRPSHELTFLSLRDQGLIDFDEPRASKILRLISMGAEESAENKGGVALISQKVRQQELAAFTEWIVAGTRDPKLRTAPKLAATELAKPQRPAEVIRHARTDRLLQSFEDNIWAQRFRCSGCHSPAGSENARLVAEHGEEVTWMKTEGAEAVMNYLITSKLINSRDPEKSLFLRKPLEEVKHGGGKKMVRGDLGYKAWRAWLDDYAKVVNDRYTHAADLPARKVVPDSFPTEIWLKLTNTPPAWAERLLQVTVFAWDAGKAAWETEPIANSDRLVWGKGKLWQHSLLLLAAKGSPRSAAWNDGKPALTNGRYLVKVHVDGSQRLETDWAQPMGETEYVGQAVIESKWTAGYDRMTALEAGRIQK